MLCVCASLLPLLFPLPLLSPTPPALARLKKKKKDTSAGTCEAVSFFSWSLSLKDKRWGHNGEQDVQQSSLHGDLFTIQFIVAEKQEKCSLFSSLKDLHQRLIGARCCQETFERDNNVGPWISFTRKSSCMRSIGACLLQWALGRAAASSCIPTIQDFSYFKYISVQSAERRCSSHCTGRIVECKWMTSITIDRNKKKQKNNLICFRPVKPAEGQKKLHVIVLRWTAIRVT